MNPLLDEPTAAQLRLLEVIFDGYAANEGEAWPIFQYVDRRLRDDGLDARSLALTCPAVHLQGPHYGWLVSVDHHQLQSIQPEHHLGLTVAGMRWLERGKAEVQRFLAVLDDLVARERAFEPSPREIQRVEVHSGDLLHGLSGDQRDAVLARMPGVLDHEPPTWSCQLRPGERPFDWTLALGSQLRWYDEIEDADAYVVRVVEVLAPPQPQPPALHPSSLSLPEAIDYLNVVWRLGVGNGRPLIAIARAEAAAKLALDCATADELDARLSAFCGMLDHLEIPGLEGRRKLNDLRTHLDSVLPPDSADRACGAIDDLRAFAALRGWRQHPGADDRGANAMRRLGLQLPTADWDTAWGHLKARAVAALAAVREEVQALDLPIDGAFAAKHDVALPQDVR